MACPTNTETEMATNTGKGSRVGSVTNRTQVQNTKTGDFVKRNTSTGRFMDVKSGGTAFKGVAHEKDGRRT